MKCQNYQTGYSTSSGVRSQANRVEAGISPASTPPPIMRVWTFIHSLRIDRHPGASSHSLVIPVCVAKLAQMFLDWLAAFAAQQQWFHTPSLRYPDAGYVLWWQSL
jgi:hypothetical protein